MDAHEPLAQLLTKNIARSASSVTEGSSALSKASEAHEACIAVNHFLKNHFPNGSWTSIAILYNPNVGLHRDILNMPGLMNHAIAVGSFSGGRVWVEDERGTSKAHLATKNGFRELSGMWVDMYNTPVSFDARRFHQVEPHEGNMWALAAYTPQAFKRCTLQHRQKLTSLGFPLPH